MSNLLAIRNLVEKLVIQLSAWQASIHPPLQPSHDFYKLGSELLRCCNEMLKNSASENAASASGSELLRLCTGIGQDKRFVNDFELFIAKLKALYDALNHLPMNFSTNPLPSEAREYIFNWIVEIEKALAPPPIQSISVSKMDDRLREKIFGEDRRKMAECVKRFFSADNLFTNLPHEILDQFFLAFPRLAEVSRSLSIEARVSRKSMREEGLGTFHLRIERMYGACSLAKLAGATDLLGTSISPSILRVVQELALCDLLSLPDPLNQVRNLDTLQRVLDDPGAVERRALDQDVVELESRVTFLINRVRWRISDDEQRELEVKEKELLRVKEVLSLSALCEALIMLCGDYEGFVSQDPDASTPLDNELNGLARSFLPHFLLHAPWLCRIFFMKMDIIARRATVTPAHPVLMDYFYPRLPLPRHFPVYGETLQNPQYSSENWTEMTRRYFVFRRIALLFLNKWTVDRKDAVEEFLNLLSGFFPYRTLMKDRFNIALFALTYCSLFFGDIVTNKFVGFLYDLFQQLKSDTVLPVNFKQFCPFEMDDDLSGAVEAYLGTVDRCFEDSLIATRGAGLNLPARPSSDNQNLSLRQVDATLVELPMDQMRSVRFAHMFKVCLAIWFAIHDQPGKTAMLFKECGASGARTAINAKQVTMNNFQYIFLHLNPDETAKFIFDWLAVNSEEICRINPQDLLLPENRMTIRYFLCQIYIFMYYATEALSNRRIVNFGAVGESELVKKFFNEHLLPPWIWVLWLHFFSGLEGNKPNLLFCNRAAHGYALIALGKAIYNIACKEKKRDEFLAIFLKAFCFLEGVFPSKDPLSRNMCVDRALVKSIFDRSIIEDVVSGVIQARCSHQMETRYEVWPKAISGLNAFFWMIYFEVQDEVCVNGHRIKVDRLSGSIDWTRDIKRNTPGHHLMSILEEVKRFKEADPEKWQTACRHYVVPWLASRIVSFELCMYIFEQLGIRYTEKHLEDAITLIKMHLVSLNEQHPFLADNLCKNLVKIEAILAPRKKAREEKAAEARRQEAEAQREREEQIRRANAAQDWETKLQELSKNRFVGMSDGLLFLDITADYQTFLEELFQLVQSAETSYFSKGTIRDFFYRLELSAVSLSIVLMRLFCHMPPSAEIIQKIVSFIQAGPCTQHLRMLLPGLFFSDAKKGGDALRVLTRRRCFNDSEAQAVRDFCSFRKVKNQNVQALLRLITKANGKPEEIKAALKKIPREELVAELKVYWPYLLASKNISSEILSLLMGDDKFQISQENCQHALQLMLASSGSPKDYPGYERLTHLLQTLKKRPAPLAPVKRDEDKTTKYFSCLSLRQVESLRAAIARGIPCKVEHVPDTDNIATLSNFLSRAIVFLGEDESLNIYHPQSKERKGQPIFLCQDAQGNYYSVEVNLGYSPAGIFEIIEKAISEGVDIFYDPQHGRMAAEANLESFNVLEALSGKKLFTDQASSTKDDEQAGPSSARASSHEPASAVSFAESPAKRPAGSGQTVLSATPVLSSVYSPVSGGSRKRRDSDSSGDSQAKYVSVATLRPRLT